MAVDRLKEAFFALVRAGNPGIDYLTSYRARVVKQDTDTGKLDVQPDDPRLPSMSNLRLKLGIPGAAVSLDTVAPAFVQISWENGDPTKPFASLFEGGATVIKLSISASSIVLDGGSVFVGSEDGAEPATKGQTLQAYLNQLATALTSHVHPGVTVGVAATLVSPGLVSIKPPTVTADKAKVA